MKKPKKRKSKRRPRSPSQSTPSVDYGLILQRLYAPPWYDRPVTFAPARYLWLLLCLAPALLLSFAGYQKWENEKFAAQIQWVKTTGRIVEVDAIPVGVRYTQRIRYTYTVDDREYTSGQRDLLRNCPVKRATAQNLLRIYSLNQEVPVYYARNNPNFAALDPFRRQPGSSFLMWLALPAFPLWLAFLIFAIGFDISSRLGKSKKPALKQAASKGTVKESTTSAKTC